MSAVEKAVLAGYFFGLFMGALGMSIVLRSRR